MLFPQLFTWGASANPGLHNNLTLPDHSYLGTWLRCETFRRTRKKMCNTQLHRRQLERTYHSLLVIGITSVYHSTQNAPYQNVSPCYNLRARIHITEDHYITFMVNSLSRTDSTP